MNGTARSVGFGARCAGATIALGYLLGFVSGPLVPVIGGLALVTYGHGLLLDRGSRTFAAAGLAIVAGAIGIGALRWGAMGLDAIRGAQQVLGPTVLVGPEAASAASWMAALSAIAGLAVWISAGYRDTWPARAAWVAEAALGSLAVVWIFWGDAHVTESQGALVAGVRWAAAVAVAGAAVIGLAVVIARLGPSWRWAVAGVAAAGVIGAAAVIASVL